jgi:hypothetical protein
VAIRQAREPTPGTPPECRQLRASAAIRWNEARRYRAGWDDPILATRLSSGVGSRERAPNHPVLCWLKTVVVSDRGKAELEVGTRETCQKRRPEAGGSALRAWGCTPFTVL